MLLAFEACTVNEFRVLAIKARQLCHHAVCHRSRVPSRCPLSRQVLSTACWCCQGWFWILEEVLEVPEAKRYCRGGARRAGGGAGDARGVPEMLEGCRRCWRGCAEAIEGRFCLLDAM